jgi:hypothetical protein
MRSESWNAHDAKRIALNGSRSAGDKAAKPLVEKKSKLKKTNSSVRLFSKPDK